MLTLLHTSPVHVPVFDALRDREHPGLVMRHVVDEELLRRARSGGPGAADSAIAAVLAEAVGEGGATAVLCTCSTIGAAAEANTARLGVPVLRVDRPMAAAAVAAAPERDMVRIAVVATVENTFGPTRDVIREEADAAGRTAVIRTVPAEGAWKHFEDGDRESYLDLVARTVDTITGVDVVVLAQASMADAAARTRTGTAVPVLSSPAPGLRAAAAAVR
ncbi:aspartate/glutamate racemase family protein [Streptomyces flavidovirens]|uniref:aspartate/glutamate racemase family protein n=1 Tax=Streptomyces flavidovirens TaxID=67298 RepID=UPI00049160D0|nr:aspartate/glutamate racemase family protein [Streptomyces flavidovirens]